MSSGDLDWSKHLQTNQIPFIDIKINNSEVIFIDNVEIES